MTGKKIRGQVKDGIGNGNMKLRVGGGRYFRVWGGPSYDVPSSHSFLKMAKEINMICDIDCPTEDFSIPSTKDADSALYRAVSRIIAGKRLYVGCMGGYGRTGLMLSLIAKAFGQKSPIPYVRRNYCKHAVEREVQFKFVTKYRVPPEVKAMVKAAKLTAFLESTGSLTFRKQGLRYKLRMWAYAKVVKFLTAPNTI